MNKKGFTLVELLAVIVLLGVVSLVIIPKVGDSITNSRNQAYETQVLSIKKGVNDFLIENSSLLSTDGTFSLKLGVIKQGGYLPVNIKNPITRKNFSNESNIKIIKNGDTYDIELELVDLEDVTENIDGNSPILVLNGDYVQYVNVNTDYEELWASAKSSSGEDLDDISRQIKINDEEVSSVDTSGLNTYNIIYSVTDDDGNTTSATRTVIVRDIEAPVISVPTETILHVSQVAGYDLMNGVVVTDNYDTDLNVTVDSGLSDITGKYVITYTATDSNNNQSVERRVINVVDSLISSDYQRLDYIYSNGNQGLNIGYKAKTTTELRLDIQFVENENLESDSSINTFIGRSSATGDNFNVNFGSLATQNKRIYYWLNESYSDGGTAYSQLYSSVTERSTMIIKSGYVSFQGVETVVAEKTNDNTAGLTLLGGSANSTFNRYDTKIYGFQIYEDGNLIMNLVPSHRLSDGAVGLFDDINNVFYSSVGKLPFEKGYN